MAVIFSDGFESGNTSAWTTVEKTPTVQDTVKHHGTYALEIDDFSECVSKTFGSTYTTIYARLYFRAAALTFINEQYIHIMRLDNGGGGLLGATARVYCYAGDYRFAMYDGWWGQLYDSGVVCNLDTWYCIELMEVVGDLASGSKMWVNGVLKCTGGGMPDGQSVAILKEVGNNAYSLDIHYIDCVVVAEEYIGPETGVPPFGTLIKRRNR